MLLRLFLLFCCFCCRSCCCYYALSCMSSDDFMLFLHDLIFFLIFAILKDRVRKYCSDFIATNFSNRYLLRLTLDRDHGARSRVYACRCMGAFKRLKGRRNRDIKETETNRHTHKREREREHGRERYGHIIGSEGPLHFHLKSR